MGIIAVVALLVFGPSKLPEVMGQAGKMVRDFRRMSAELSGEFEKTIAEAKDATAGLNKELTGMSKQVSSVTNSVKKDLNTTTTKSVNTSRTQRAVAGSTTGSKSSPTASKAKAGARTSTAKTTSAKSPASTSATKPATTTSGATATKPAPKPPTAVKPTPVIPIASREDPAADLSLFEPEVIDRPVRSRRATASAISDHTPRVLSVDVLAGGSGDTRSSGGEHTPDDPLARARARRRNAGYGQSIASQ